MILLGEVGSLGRRVGLAVIGTTTAVVLVAGGLVWIVTRSVLVDSVDDQLVLRAARLDRLDDLPASDPWWTRPASVADADPDPATHPGWPESRHLEGHHRDHPERAERHLVQALGTTDGQELDRSSTLSIGSSLAQEGIDTRGEPWSVHLPDGSHVRVLALHLDHLPPGHVFRVDGNRTGPVGPPGGVTVLLGEHLDEVDAELWHLTIILALLVLGAPILALILARVLLPQVLRPVRAMAEAIRTLGPKDFTARLLPDLGPSELHGVATCVNDLMTRLEGAFERERMTTANLAHELRTPISALRMALEVRQAAATDPLEVTALAAHLAIVGRMQHQVTNLLLLARLEAGTEPLPQEEECLSDLLEDACERWRRTASARGQRLQVMAPAQEVVIPTSVVHLELLLDNVLGNACAHGDAGGTIDLQLQIINGRFQLEISNGFSGKVELERLGRSYYRGDASRRSEDHAGLGLALVRRLALVLGLDCTFRTDDHRFQVVVSGPAMVVHPSG